MVDIRGYDLDSIFGALSDPTRRAILRRLTRSECSVMEIAEPFHMSLAAVSKHIKVLEQARLIRREKRGTFYYASLNPQALKTAEQWLAYYERFWSERLDSLKRYLEKDD